MTRVSHILSIVACSALCCIAAHAADVPAKPESKSTNTAKPGAAVEKKADPVSPAKPAKALPQTLVPLRDLVRQTLEVQRNQAYNSGDNTATEILGYSLGFGCGTEVALNGAGGQRINGITCLCWNYPCAGFEMLGFNQNRVAAKIGYGSQERPGEFLAALALSRVPADYPVRVGKTTRTVADIVESEKLDCRSGNDLSLKLISLPFYVEQPEWKNDLGETWSIERIMREEISQPVVTAPEGGLNRLMGLSYAVSRRAKQGLPLDGQYERAQKYTSEFQTFALQMQNADGSWGSYFLAARSTSPDLPAQLRSTGRIVEWLAMSLPDEKLTDSRMTNAVQCLARLLGSQQYQNGAAAVSTQEIVSMGHALHALNVYDSRVFKPTDGAAEKPATEEKATADEPAAGQPAADESRAEQPTAARRGTASRL